MARNQPKIFDLCNRTTSLETIFFYTMAKVSYVLKVFCSKKCCVQDFLLLFSEMSFGAVSTMLVYCAVAQGFSDVNNFVLLCFNGLCNFPC